ncbi:hypothetical protein Q5H93_19805 [Hymenobacter sp. ASUV-10]|uniref:DNA binding HTH domain-containing protein n=1 Tax=Hymenobacter aranciens TaxID=3063996 RepID=A0ABT9BK24_9BACT|nr:hypothetical protein [Hymenobacter sp. ASUV-10]MDO7877001.1 hypothetical protein [Hymenobacter sp. ASUV-10]
MSTQHRGEIVAEAVRRSGMKLSRLHKVLGISRPTLYRRFEDPNLEFEFIKQVGRAIYYDFGQDFKELSTSGLVAEPIAGYSLETVEDYKNKLLHVYGLYIEMVEKYNALLSAQGSKK